MRKTKILKINSSAKKMPKIIFFFAEKLSNYFFFVKSDHFFFKIEHSKMAFFQRVGIPHDEGSSGHLDV